LASILDIAQRRCTKTRIYRALLCYIIERKRKK